MPPDPPPRMAYAFGVRMMPPQNNDPGYATENRRIPLLVMLWRLFWTIKAKQKIYFVTIVRERRSSLRVLKTIGFRFGGQGSLLQYSMFLSIARFQILPDG